MFEATASLEEKWTDEQAAGVGGLVGKTRHAALTMRSAGRSLAPLIWGRPDDAPTTFLFSCAQPAQLTQFPTFCLQQHNVRLTT